MEPLKPSAMLPHIRDFPNILRHQVEPLAHRIQDVLSSEAAAAIHRIYLLGDGDSFHASLSADMAYNTIAKIPCEPYSAQRFLDYRVEWLPEESPESTLVVGVSASGTTKRVIHSLEKAKAKGAITTGITGRPGSAITTITDQIICAELPKMGPAPGMRSYMGSLLGHYLLAIRLAELRGVMSERGVNAVHKELVDLGDVLEGTIAAAEAPAKEAAEAFADSPVIVFIGSGPSYGTAVFSAAKVIEAAGVFSMGQDLEEWTHVEFFAYPSDMPTFLIAPPGNSHWRAVELADMVKSYGRRLGAVVKEDDLEITRHADFVIPVVGDVREAFSPLVYHVAADYFSCFLTETLGRHLFQSDNEAFMEANRQFLARDRIR